MIFFIQSYDTKVAATPAQHSGKVDILSPAAMQNAYHICHNVQVFQIYIFYQVFPLCLYFSQTVVLHVQYLSGSNVLSRLPIQNKWEFQEEGEEKIDK